MTTEGQGKRSRLEARLLMKRPVQFGQDARIFPGTKVMVNGARAREQSGVSAPLATGLQQVKDRVKDGAQVARACPPARPGGGRYGAIQAQAASLRSVS